MMILNIMFWKGDRDNAMELARLIADIEPAEREDVAVMFTARFDCEHDEKTIEYVADKLPVLRYTTRRNATGWPNGPNQMVGCSVEHLFKAKKRGQIDAVDAVMLVEADCVPLRKTWITELYDEFKASKKLVSGAWLTKEDCGTLHVNGNCIISIDLPKTVPGIMHPATRGGWDATLAWGLMPNAHPSKLIWSDYQLGMAHNPWRGDDYLWEAKEYRSKTNPLYGQKLQPCWFHGLKTDKGLIAARKRLVEK
jgi:hypothetical protein